MSEKKLTITGPHKMPEGHFIIRAIIHEAGERDSVEAMEFDDFESADAEMSELVRSWTNPRDRK